MKPHLILAALDAAVCRGTVKTRYDQGVDWAQREAAFLIVEARYKAHPTDHDVLDAVREALQVWLGGGPDDDRGDYGRGCRVGMARIKRVLDGDYKEITRLLAAVKNRAHQQFSEAVNEPLGD